MTPCLTFLLTALLLVVPSLSFAQIGITHDPAPRLPGDESPAAPIEILDPFGRAVLMDAYGRFMRPPFDPNAAQPAAAAHEQASSTIGGPSESVTAAGWEFVGPEGGNVVDLAVSPTEPGLVIAALQYDGIPGLYRSTDGGRTWTPAIRSGYEEFLCVVFAADGIPYAGSSNGIYEGSRDGTTWRPLPLPSSYGPRVSSITIHPTRRDEIWIGATAYLLTSPILRTTDRGRTWSNVPIPGYPYRDCSQILFNPANPSEVFATFATYGYGGNVWYSADAGATWSFRSNARMTYYINDLLFDGDRLWLAGGHRFYNMGVGVWTSTNKGRTWTQVSMGWPTQVVNDLELDPSNPGTVLAATDMGVYRSTDHGATWEFGVGETAHHFVNAVKIVPGTSRVLAGTECYGVLAKDGGGSFAPSSRGMRAIGITCVAASPTDPLEMTVGFAGQNTGGMVTSRDGGVSWTRENLPQNRWLQARYTSDGTLYALAGGPFDVTGEGVYRRNPGGSWTQLGPDLGPLMENYFLTFHVGPDRQIVVGGLDATYPHNDGTIWRTGSGGTGWVRRYTGSPYAYVYDVESVGDASGGILLASSGNGILRSEDGGWTWNPSGGGLPTNVRGGRLSRSPVDPDLVYATAEYPYYLLRSNDAGLHWTMVPGWTGGPADVACDPSDRNVIYVTPSSVVGTQVMRSEDAGRTFSWFGQGLESGVGNAFALVESPCRQLLMATWGGVMRRSIERTPPELSVRVDRPAGWPPNHRHLPVHVSADLRDLCDPNPTYMLRSITANEPLDPDDIRGAAYGTPDTEFELAFERDGTGNGRRYLVTYVATDAGGNTRTATTEVTVPHDLGGSLAARGERDAGFARPTSLASISPNPFRLDAEVSFSLSRTQRIDAEVFDMGGRRVRVLAAGSRDAGAHRLKWDGRDERGGAAPNGIYIIRLTTEEGRWTQRVARVR